MEKVLIIDDNPTDRFIQQKMLESQYETKVAASHMEGAEIIKQWQPDIIIVDYAMPEMNGIQAIKYYKEKLNYDGIYLILTGLDDINIATEAIRRGAYDYLVKPLVSTIFNNKVRNCMNYRKLLKSEKEKIANVAIETIILSIFYEMKPLCEKLNEVTDLVLAKGKDNDLLEVKKYLDKLCATVNKLGNLDEHSKKEYVESILEYYLK